MSLILEPLKLEELDDYIKVYWEAFEPLEANMIFPMIYPNGLQPDLLERMRKRILTQSGGDLGSYCFCAKDSTSHELVGVAWWDLVQNSPETKEDIDAQFEHIAKMRRGGTTVEGMNEELDRAFFAAAFYSELEIMAGQTYMILRLLATTPRFQRRGAGSFLLKAALEKADQLRLPVYLDSGVSGKPLYERFGFKVVRDMPLNCLDYGGRSDGRHWCMVRPAKA